MATLAELIASVESLQSSIDILTESINFRKSNLEQAVSETQSARDTATQQVEIAQELINQAEEIQHLLVLNGLLQPSLSDPKTSSGTPTHSKATTSLSFKPKKKSRHMFYNTQEQSTTKLTLI